jgi:single-stranded-DNA-specific exonuclease
MAIWKQQSIDESNARSLSGEVGVSLPVARLLLKRGYGKPSAARRFLNPQPVHLLDPYLMLDMDKAVERMGRAISGREKIFVFGDYDVDGVTSITLLCALLDQVGANYRIHQPNRLKEGYGLSRSGVDMALDFGADLLFSLDCGTEAGEAIEYAKSRGLDVIVIDHHKQKGVLPPANAVLNPNRKDCPYPFKGLAAAGVVFKFLHAGFSRWKAHLDWERLYQIAALGTVADVAPLVDENRVITKVGIHFLERQPDPALAALLQVAGVEPGQLNAGHLSFQLAPRLNAAGRMGSPEIGRRLLLSKDPGEIRELAGYLNKLNYQRRSLQAEIYDQSVAMIESDLAKYLRNVIVVAGEGWNKGIVGIVAAKIQERYYRPTVVIALDGETGSGSARSIPGFDLFSAISRCSSFLSRFGGHRAAAGLSIDRNRIDEFRDRFDRVAGEMLGEDDLIPKLAIDAELSISDVGLKLIDELTSLEPFGMGNRRPVFSSSAVTLSGSPVVMGKKKNHLKIRVGAGNNISECVGWDMARRIEELNTERIDVAYQLKADEWRNRRRVQMVLKDFRVSMTDDG